MACSGPTNEKWDGETCVGTPAQTSCDGFQTCYYADIQLEGGGQRASKERQYFGGQFIDKNAESGDFRIDLPGPLIHFGVQPGDVLISLNMHEPTAKAILSFTAARPAKDIECLRLRDGRIVLRLGR